MSFVLCTVMMCSLLSVSEDALNASEATSLAPGIFILKGAVNTGVFIAGNSALLIDCCETATPERLRALGVDRVEMVCMTQHRRPNAMGAYRFVEEQGAQVLVSEKDRSLFEGLDAYWTDPHNRWHLITRSSDRRCFHVRCPLPVRSKKRIPLNGAASSCG